MADSSDEGATINVRTTKQFREEVDRAAADLGMNRSAYVIHQLQNAVSRQPPGRQVQVERPRRLGMSIAPSLCSHPMQLRSEPAEDGTSRCMACNAEVRRVP